MATAHIDTFAKDNLPPADQQPVFLLDRPEFQYPEKLNAAVELIGNPAFKDRIAVIDKAGRTTFGQMDDLSSRIAAVLVEDMGVVPGNRVLLHGPNCKLMAACWLGILKAGAIAVATMPLLRAADLAPVIAKAKVTHALAHPELMEALAPTTSTVKTLNFAEVEAKAAGKQPLPPVETYAEDLALIAFTSGTTGVPKGTMHFHRDVMVICDGFPRSMLETRADDIFIGTPPLAFTFGLGGLVLFPWRYGAASVLIERYTPQSLLEAIRDYKATVTFTAPTFYRLMAQAADGIDISSLRACVSAGEALPAAIRAAWKKASGIEMIDGIGATEMLHIFISHKPGEARPGATGKPIPGYEAKIVDQEFNEVPVGEVGRLAVRGPTGCRYLADDRQRNYVKNGWNLTGDAYLKDSDGYFFFQSRTDDMIVSAGYNIAGIEVENVLLGHPAVSECAVIGVADGERGQIVKAFVVLKSGEAASEALVKTLQEHVKATIAPYKYPRAIEFRDVLPKTETGKLQRFKLRDQTGV
ncbi:AMP-binding protein [Lacibacterium aquatile]|uniref:AMP-binding protein n=1 Tax=Lacibacterium aquatile TaxID=1168082 RepID=A0ABW5E0G8_9PROT